LPSTSKLADWNTLAIAAWLKQQKKWSVICSPQSVTRHQHPFELHTAKERHRRLWHCLSLVVAWSPTQQCRSGRQVREVAMWSRPRCSCDTAPAALCFCTVRRALAIKQTQIHRKRCSSGSPEVLRSRPTTTPFGLCPNGAPAFVVSSQARDTWNMGLKGYVHCGVLLRPQTCEDPHCSTRATSTCCARDGAPVQHRRRRQHPGE
jgi:hypothetical protein